ncbi:hypothetical protein P154DRAFT_221112 [Amniculicola lignicola CBS 123094]|uniref:Secreted protein n=1 Tax=Amniculicola lignicola CBS 123094 TaxID=1392246 RepID=A0A6A5WY60_9PLEO|nr:hypothetical protein P154DRAFT_221112 [Amniculicola lignicola CBS 123094]
MFNTRRVEFCLKIFIWCPLCRARLMAKHIFHLVCNLQSGSYAESIQAICPFHLSPPSSTYRLNASSLHTHNTSA